MLRTKNSVLTLGTQHLASSSWYSTLTLGIQHFPSSTWYATLGTQHLASDSWYPTLGIRHTIHTLITRCYYYWCIHCMTPAAVAGDNTSLQYLHPWHVTANCNNHSDCSDCSLSLQSESCSRTTVAVSCAAGKADWTILYCSRKHFLEPVSVMLLPSKINTRLRITSNQHTLHKIQ